MTLSVNYMFTLTDVNFWHYLIHVAISFTFLLTGVNLCCKWIIYECQENEILECTTTRQLR